MINTPSPLPHQQYSFSINLNSFYAKLREVLTKTLKFSTFCRRLSNLKLFSLEQFWIKEMYYVLLWNVRNVAKMKHCMKLGRFFATQWIKDGRTEWYIVCLNKCMLSSFKLLANNLDIHFIWTQCISIIIFLTFISRIKMQHIHLINWHARSYLE